MVADFWVVEVWAQVWNTPLVYGIGMAVGYLVNEFFWDWL